MTVSSVLRTVYLAHSVYWVAGDGAGLAEKGEVAGEG